jgi:tRNA threonylcarbamoyladenosine modification (KEOPS) complex  Pcc1 subunit
VRTATANGTATPRLTPSGADKSDGADTGTIPRGARSRTPPTKFNAKPARNLKRKRVEANADEDEASCDEDYGEQMEVYEAELKRKQRRIDALEKKLAHQPAVVPVKTPKRTAKDKGSSAPDNVEAECGDSGASQSSSVTVMDADKRVLEARAEEKANTKYTVNSVLKVISLFAPNGTNSAPPAADDDVDAVLAQGFKVGVTLDMLVEKCKDGDELAAELKKAPISFHYGQMFLIERAFWRVKTDLLRADVKKSIKAL